MKDNIEIIQSYLEKEITYAEIYKNILDKWYDKIKNHSSIQSFHQNHSEIFLIIRTAIQDSFILSMAKIFADSNEGSLWKFIQLASEVSDAYLEKKLKKKLDFVKKECEEKRNVFLTNKETYINEIKKIRNKLKPLRNIERAHNIPWRKNGTSATWKELKKWLCFAEKIYADVLESIVEAYPLNGLVPEELNRQIDSYLNYICLRHNNSIQGA